jgi:hypothetical protein
MLRNERERHVASRAKKALAIVLEPMAHMAHPFLGCHAPP